MMSTDEVMTGSVDDAHVDGNALAGPLAEVFVADMTMARFRCAGCGQVWAVAETMAWTHGPGLVARCAGCEAVLLRMVRTPTTWRVDLSGCVEVRLPAGSPS